MIILNFKMNNLVFFRFIDFFLTFIEFKLKEREIENLILLLSRIGMTCHKKLTELFEHG